MKRTLKIALSLGLVGAGYTLWATPGLHSDTFPEDSLEDLEKIQVIPIPESQKVHSIRAVAEPRPVQAVAGRPQFGDPLLGLTASQLEAFAEGRGEFESEEDIAGGLGPIFNDVSCVSCHFTGAVGGGSAVKVTRFGREINGVYDPLEARGGSLLQKNAIDRAARELVPPEANIVARRQSTPLFGLGLIEAIPDAEIKRNEIEEKDIAPRPGTGGYIAALDGIHGRAAIITDVVSGEQRVGRFGWKAQQATVLAFAGDAYLNEMGITNRFFPKENAPNGDLKRLEAFDSVKDIEDEADPSTGRSDIDAAADFMRFLGPPPRLPLTAAALAGQKIFNDISCATCHKPMMMTGPNPIAALNRKPVPLYSDLLLHDMGSLGDHIAQAAAKPTEMRTPPLWGLRASAPYLHDGRAPSIDKAIRHHDGEAANARDMYLRLSDRQRQQLQEFLNSI